MLTIATLRRPPRSPRARSTSPRLLAVAALLGATLSVLSAGPAAAHSALLSTDPAEGSTLSTAPAQVSLVFNEDVAPQFVDGAITIGTAPATAVTATVDAGTVALAVPAGSARGPAAQPWRVDYRVVSADGHPISGSLSFTVEASAPTVTPVAPSTSTTATAPLPPSPSDADTASAPATTSTEAASAGAGSGGGASSVVALSTGLAAVGGAIVGTVIVIVRRRRQGS